MPYTEDRTHWFAGQGLWSHIPESDWKDWTWQLKNRITTIEQLERYMTLTPSEKAGCLFAKDKLPHADEFITAMPSLPNPQTSEN